MRRKDKFSKAKRSLIMSRIRSRNTKLDLAMRRILRKADINFKAYPKIYGSPDFLVGQKIVVFCDSSFWHGRNWPKLRRQLLRGSNWRYWVAHIAKNRARDREVNLRLRKEGYSVLRFWDSAIFREPEKCTGRLERAIAAARPSHSAPLVTQPLKR